MTLTTPETPEITAARRAYFRAQTQGNRFDLAIAVEALVDAKVIAYDTGGLIEAVGEHPVELKRQESTALRVEQEARLEKIDGGVPAEERDAIWPQPAPRPASPTPAGHDNCMVSTAMRQG